MVLAIGLANGLATGLALLSPGLPPASPAPGEEGPVHELLADLPARWEEAREALAVPGLAAVVVLDDEVALLLASGRRDVERGLPVTPDSAFYIASATKPFVAFALASLAAEGEVDLDAPVQDYLPRFRLADAEAAARITVRDLLCHAPGINHGLIVLLDAYTGEITEDRYYHFLEEVTPTGRVTYTNVHFTLAGRVIEAVTGRSWRDELAVRVLGPSGMERTTGYADEMYARADVAFPMVGGPDGPRRSPVLKTDRTMHAAGGMGTTARDLGRWLRLNLNLGELDGKTILPERWAAEMQTLQSEGDAGGGRAFAARGFGLGWMIGSQADARMLQHGGGYVGSSALIAFLPELGIGIGVLANADGAGQELCQLVVGDVLDRLLGFEPELAPLPAPRVAAGGDGADAAPDGDGAELALAPEAYAGSYVDEWLGTFTTRAEDGALYGNLGDLPVRLVPAGAERFRLDAPAMGGFLRFEIEDGRPVAIRIEEPLKALFVRQAPEKR